MRLLIFALLFWTPALLAAPRCKADHEGPQDTRLRRMTGHAAEFASGEPVFVTVTNGGKKYTTTAGQDGRWEVLIHNAGGETDILCWQGFENVEDARDKAIAQSLGG